MFRYATFSLLGLLVGMAIFSFGYYTNMASNRAALRAPAQVKVDELQKNVVLDSVPATAPESLGNSNIPVTASQQTAVSIPSLNSLTRAELDALTAAALKQQAESLAAEIVTPAVPPKEEPEVIEGWANAAFLPIEDQGPDIQINDIPEPTEEIVR